MPSPGVPVSQVMFMCLYVWAHGDEDSHMMLQSHTKPHRHTDSGKFLDYVYYSRYLRSNDLNSIITFNKILDYFHKQPSFSLSKTRPLSVKKKIQQKYKPNIIKDSKILRIRKTKIKIPVLQRANKKGQFQRRSKKSLVI